MGLRVWLAAHWREMMQGTGYVAIATAGFVVWLPLGLLLVGVALVLIANGW